MLRYAVSTRESEGNKEIIWGLSNQFDFYSRYPLRILKKSDGTWHAGYSGVSPTLYTFEHFYTATGNYLKKTLTLLLPLNGLSQQVSLHGKTLSN